MRSNRECPDAAPGRHGEGETRHHNARRTSPGGGLMSVPQAGAQIAQRLVDANLLTVDDLAEQHRGADAAGEPVPVHLVSTGRSASRRCLGCDRRPAGPRVFEQGPAQSSHPKRLVGFPPRLRFAEVALPMRIDSGRLVLATDDPLDDARRLRLPRLPPSEVVMALAATPLSSS